MNREMDISCLESDTNPEAILNRLEDWIAYGNRHNRSQYLYDWHGRRCDGFHQDKLGNLVQRPACNILWQVVNQYCKSPREDLRLRLDRILECESILSDTIRRFALSHDDSIYGFESYLGAVFSLSRTALLFVDICAAVESGADPSSIEELQLEFKDESQLAIGQLLEFHGVTEFLRIPTTARSEGENADPIRRFLAKVCAGLTASNNWSANGRKIVQSLVQYDSTLRWLTHTRNGQPQSSNGHVAFACQNRGTETGSLALLGVRAYPIPELSEIASEPVLVSDLVYHGFLQTDGLWRSSFDIAAKWGVKRQVADRQNVFFLYDLNFKYANSQDPLKDTFGRPDRISGPSASLAASVLVRSQSTDKPVDSKCCYVGAIGETGSGGFEFQQVSGVFPKSAAMAKCRFQGSVIVGRLAAQDKAELRNWGLFSSIDQLVEVESPEKAFDVSTRLREAIHAYIQSEKRIIWKKIGSFAPKRLHDSLNIENQQRVVLDDFYVLDQINSPQVAMAAFRTKRTSGKSSGKTPSTKAEQVRVSLDSVIECFINRSYSYERPVCLKIIGGPGMGKTWVGLRWHLKLLTDLWTESQQGRAESESTGLPVWTTFVELQQAMKRNPGAPLATILIDIVSSRLTHEMCSELKDGVLSLIQSNIKRKTLFLFVDSWDERDQESESESHVVDQLSDWLSSSRAVLTSRMIGEAGSSRDPLRRIHPSTPWRIVRDQEESEFENFAHKWFGEDFEFFRDVIRGVAHNQNLNEVTCVPQLAAIVCSLIYHGDLPNNSVENSSQLLRFSILKTLEKRESPKNAEAIISVLQELAFRTFDAQRWQVSIAALKEELSKEAYRELVDTLGVSRIADAIFQSGIFDESDSSQSKSVATVIHQCLPEVLAGVSLATLIAKSDRSAQPTKSHDVLRVIFLDSRWDGVFVHFVQLAENCTPILHLLCEMERSSHFRDSDLARLYSRIKTCFVYGKFSEVPNELKAWAGRIFTSSLFRFDDECCKFTGFQELAKFYKNSICEGLGERWTDAGKEDGLPAFDIDILVCFEDYRETILPEQLLTLLRNSTNVFFYSNLAYLDGVVNCLNLVWDNEFEKDFEKCISNLSCKDISELLTALESVPNHLHTCYRLESYLGAENWKKLCTSSDTEELIPWEDPDWNFLCNHSATLIAIAGSAKKILQQTGDRVPCDQVEQLIRVNINALQTAESNEFFADEYLPIDRERVKRDALKIWATAFWSALEHGMGYSYGFAIDFWNAIVEIESATGVDLLNGEFQERLDKAIEAARSNDEESEENDANYLDFYDVSWTAEARKRFAAEGDSQSKLPKDSILQLLQSNRNLRYEPLVLVHLEKLEWECEVQFRSFPEKPRRMVESAFAYFRRQIWVKTRKRFPEIKKLEDDFRAATSLELADNILLLLENAVPVDPIVLARQVLSTQALVRHRATIRGVCELKDLTPGYCMLSNDWFARYGLVQIGESKFVQLDKRTLGEVLDDPGEIFECAAELALEVPFMKRMIRAIRIMAKYSQFLKWLIQKQNSKSRP